MSGFLPSWAISATTRSMSREHAGRPEMLATCGPHNGARPRLQATPLRPTGAEPRACPTCPYAGTWFRAQATMTLLSSERTIGSHGHFLRILCSRDGRRTRHARRLAVLQHLLRAGAGRFQPRLVWAPPAPGRGPPLRGGGTGRTPVRPSPTTAGPHLTRPHSGSSDATPAGPGRSDFSSPAPDRDHFAAAADFLPLPGGFWKGPPHYPLPHPAVLRN